MGQADCYGMSDPGLVRENNEDQYLIADLRKSMTVYSTSIGLDHHTQLFGNSSGKILMVADGMGGHPAGERASTLAVDGLTDYALNNLSWNLADSDPEGEFRSELEDALLHCQKIICRESGLNPRRRGMATTVTFAFVRWPKLYLVHAGDCRCYLLRDGELQLLTKDHNLAELASQESRENQVSPENAIEDPNATKKFPVKSAIWNYVGGDCESLQPDVKELKLKMGDSLLLCSDGLTYHVDDERLAKILAVSRSARTTCQALIDAANEDGGKDNITVVVARFLEIQKSVDALAEKVEVADDKVKLHLHITDEGDAVEQVEVVQKV